MKKYQVQIAGELQDDILDSYEEAEEYALYLLGCAKLGAETLAMSNLEYEDDWLNFEYPDYEIIEVDA